MERHEDALQLKFLAQDMAKGQGRGPQAAKPPLEPTGLCFVGAMCIFFI